MPLRAWKMLTICLGFDKLKDLYVKADPAYNGRFTVPTLWDKQKETIISNESSDIMRMLYCEFDPFIAEDLRETNKPGGGLLPDDLRKQIDEMNEWVSQNINYGVYKVRTAPYESLVDDPAEQ